MKKVIFASVGLAILMASNITKADSGYYGGVTYSVLEYSYSGENSDFETIGAIIGYNLSGRVGVELRYAEGSKGDTIIGVPIEIESTTSAFARLSLPNKTNLTPYLLAGFTYSDVSAGREADRGKIDVGYGAGVEFAISSSLSIAAEYITLVDPNYDLDGFTLAAMYDF